MAARRKAKVAAKHLSVAGFSLKADPPVYIAAMPGRWLMAHSTPSWRIDDPHKGFQRIVNEQRAKEIARTVIDPGRPFPNAIVLATNRKALVATDSALEVPETIRFLVVDGQHRLYAQEYSRKEAMYPCVIHMNRSEQQMAQLFLEINDNQKRVPSSLRWDLVRLVREADQPTTMTADLIYELAVRKESPFNATGLDMTGEQKSIAIKQGSLAPEIRALIARYIKKLDAGFEDYLSLFIRFFAAIQSIDPQGWGDTQSPFFRARTLRALIRVLSDLIARDGIETLTADHLRTCLLRIEADTISPAALRAAQGSAGVQDLYKAIRAQVLPG